MWVHIYNPLPSDKPFWLPLISRDCFPKLKAYMPIQFSIQIMDHQLQEEIFETYARSLNWMQPLKIKLVFMEIDLSITCGLSASPISLVRGQSKQYLNHLYYRVSWWYFTKCPNVHYKVFSSWHQFHQDTWLWQDILCYILVCSHSVFQNHRNMM
jgi:hypothetical protein